MAEKEFATLEELRHEFDRPGSKMSLGELSRRRAEIERRDYDKGFTDKLVTRESLTRAILSFSRYLVAREQRIKAEVQSVSRTAVAASRTAVSLGENLDELIEEFNKRVPMLEKQSNERHETDSQILELSKVLPEGLRKIDDRLTKLEQAMHNTEASGE